MSDVQCLKHNSVGVPTDEIDPESGVPIYRCLHDPDHYFAPISETFQHGWTMQRPRRTEPECKVFRCMAEPTEVFATDSPGLGVIEMGVCAAHHAALTAGEPCSFGPNDKILVGDDYRIAHEGRAG